MGDHQIILYAQKCRVLNRISVMCCNFLFTFLISAVETQANGESALNETRGRE